jgi:uncharacterized Zn finger protein (UPF0148 family)
MTVGFEEPLICSGCGILVDGSLASCKSCNTPYTTPPLRALAQPASGYWAAVRSTFQCNACKFDAPLNHFELVDAVSCTRCGHEQRYDRNEWKRLVEYAQFVADFAVGTEGRFPDPETRLPKKPFPHLGSSESWAVDQKMRASPGNPLCRTCRSMIVVDSSGNGELKTACTGCHAKRTYELRAATDYGAKGVLCDEHEAGHSEAALMEGRGSMMLGCPRCNAPLERVKDADGSITCQYCSAQCRISTKTHAKAGHKEAPVKTWWLYFDAPSKQRKKLVNEAKQTNKRDRKVASERAMAQHVANRDDAAALVAKQRIFGSNEPAQAPEASSGSMGLALVVLLLLAAGGGAVVWFLVLKR